MIASRHGVEARLLCELLTPAAPAERLEPMAASVDWERCLSLAQPTLFPLLRRRLGERLPGFELPAPVAAQVERICRAQAGLGLRQRHELGRLLAALEASGVPVLVLKGLALARLAYPAPMLRPMQDIDLLVPVARRADAASALASIGYRVPERWAVRPRSGPAAKAPEEKPLQLPGTSVLVELHTQLEWVREPFRYSIEGAWERHVATDLDGLPARTLCPDDFLLHLGMHLAAYHGFEHGLRDLVDVSLLVASRHDRWEWDRLLDAWRRQGTGGWMALVLHLARELLHAPIPRAAVDARLSTLPAAAAELAVEQIFTAPERRTPPGLVTVLRAGRPLLLLGRALRRLGPWRLDEIRERPARGLRVAWSRAIVDLRTRLPRYLAAWRSGDLAAVRVQAHLAWEERRDRLAGLMAPSERSAEIDTPRTPS